MSLSRSFLFALLLLPLAPSAPVFAHGSHGGSDESLEPGSFNFKPVITIEGHGGFDTNLEGNPKHYALDGLFGGVFEWGLNNGGSLTIEAAVGPALVWGEAEHFYGKVHVHDDHGDESHDDHGHDDHKKHAHDKHDEHDEDEHGHDDHDEHAHDDHDDDHHDERAAERKKRRRLRAQLKARSSKSASAQRKLHRMREEHHDDHGHDDHGHDDHAGHDDHGHDDHGHDDHAGHDDHGHDDHSGHGHAEHAHGDPQFERTDVRGFLSVRYAPNDRLSLTVDWKPYYVTQNQNDDIQGLKNELGAKAVWALGDGDVDFALGDGIEDLVDGVFLSVEHRQGWESDGVYIGNYTDPRIGVGFSIDEVNITFDVGPRFYVPGSYAGLDQRTDFAGELEIAIPVGDAVLFAHWQPTYSGTDAPGWGQGWQHHIGTGVTFSF